jgi:hypothetical protein
MAEVSDEPYEELRGYLEAWLERPCTFEEAKEAGDGFIDFFMLLLQLDVDQNM